eukprot:4146968-Pyramimonas_sp.AAC.1
MSLVGTDQRYRAPNGSPTGGATGTRRAGWALRMLNPPIGYPRIGFLGMAGTVMFLMFLMFLMFP